MGENNNKIPKFSFSLNWVFALIAIILVVLNFVDGSPAAKEIGYNEISTLIKKNAVEEITVTTNKRTAELRIKANKLGVAFGADSSAFKNSPYMTVKLPSADKFTEDLARWQDELNKDKADNEKVNISTKFEEDLPLKSHSKTLPD